MTFSEQAQQYFADAVARAKGGLTLETATILVRGFIALLVRAAVDLGITGAAKKELVLVWVERLIDGILPSMPWPYNWIVWILKRAVLSAAAGVIESTYQTEIKKLDPRVVDILPPAE